MRPPKNRDHVRNFDEQVKRAIAGVALQIDALPLRDRVIVLNFALRIALNDVYEAEREARSVEAYLKPVA